MLEQTQEGTLGAASTCSAMQGRIEGRVGTAPHTLTRPCEHGRGIAAAAHTDWPQRPYSPGHNIIVEASVAACREGRCTANRELGSECTRREAPTVARLIEQRRCTIPLINSFSGLQGNNCKDARRHGPTLRPQPN